MTLDEADIKRQDEILAGLVAPLIELYDLECEALDTDSVGDLLVAARHAQTDQQLAALAQASGSENDAELTPPGRWLWRRARDRGQYAFYLTPASEPACFAVREFAVQVYTALLAGTPDGGPK